MKTPGTLWIEQVIGPRLEREGIVVETHTASGKVALRLSASAAASLHHALSIALTASGPDLPEFLLRGHEPPTSTTRTKLQNLLPEQRRRQTAA